MDGIVMDDITLDGYEEPHVSREAEGDRPPLESAGRIRVLIAEDDPGLRQVMSEVILGDPAFELIAAVADTEAAIATAAASQPDVAIVDVRMPGGGGVVATRGIIDASGHTRVIAFTGHHDESVAAEMFEAGVTGYLVKGSGIDEIVRTIHTIADCAREPENLAS
jgi:DNA-binding NarL/FixJ family response regulator